MKQKRLGGRLLAAALVGVMGGGAASGVLADDDLPVVQCPIDVPFHCMRKCEAYGECIVRCDVFGRCDRDTDMQKEGHNSSVGMCHRKGLFRTDYLCPQQNQR